MDNKDLFEDIDNIIDGKIKPRTYIAIIIDESGSMDDLRKVVVDSFNEQIQTIRQQSEEQDIFISLITFSHSVNEIVWNENIKFFKEMTLEDYNPNSSTALNDAIGLTIEKFKEFEVTKNTSYLINIITDGFENCSRKFRNKEIKRLITELEKTELWSFVWMISNMKSDYISSVYGSSVNNVMVFDSSEKGYQLGANIHTTGTKAYLNSRSAGMTNTNNFYNNEIGDEDNV